MDGTDWKGDSLGEPASPNQERLWLLQNLAGEQVPFAYSVRATLSERVDIERVKAGAAALLGSCPEIGSVFSSASSGLRRFRRDVAVEQFFFERTIEADTAIDPLLDELSSLPFDLANGPLLRVLHIRRAGGGDLLALVAHRILFDRRSLRRHAQSLLAFCEGRTDVICGLGASEPQSVLDADRAAWWRSHLAAAAPVEFPIDKNRPPVQGLRRAFYEFETPAATRRSLAGSVIGGERASERRTYFAAFAALLHRYTNQDEVVIGLPMRHEPDAERAALVCAPENIAPLKLTTSPTASFDQLTAHAEQVMADALVHAAPFASLVKEIAAEDQSRAPLTQHAFSWFVDVGDDDAVIDLPATAAGEFDLHFLVFEKQDRLFVRIEYDPALFFEESIKRIAQHYLGLLNSIAADPGASLIDLEMMSEAERSTVLREWNRTARPRAQEALLHRLIEEQVAETPDRAALFFEGRTLTFDEINRRANRLANFLRSRIVQPDQLIGVRLERGPDLVAAMLAVMKAGAAYVPLDPAMPSDRLGVILEDSEATTLITHSALTDGCGAFGGDVIKIDQIGEELVGLSDENLASQPHSDSLLYVMYTSGSTGRPKGVQIEHRTVVNFLLSMRTEPGLDEQDVVLAVTTVSFDISVLELFLPLITGARIVLASERQRTDGRELLRLIEKHDVTLLQATPATWRLLLDSGWSSTPNLTALCGGEALPQDLAGEILSRCAALWNMYGPTETTVWSSLQRVVAAAEPISIGRPIDNTAIYILDAAGRCAAIGVPGELAIGGDGVGRGYFRRPDLTAEKFVADPFLHETELHRDDGAAGRMYRTGDVARYDAFGRLHFYGRLDHQVKIRGFRIELGEIEAVVCAFETVKQCVVIVREDTAGDQQIVAYWTAEAGRTVDHGALRAHLTGKLPKYMVPSFFVELERFPLGPTGKVDRKALPRPAPTARVEESVFTAPKTPEEDVVAQVFAQELNIERAGRHHDFFDLGGDSLKALRVVLEIERRSGVSLPLSAFAQAPTVEKLAALIALSRDGRALTVEQPIALPIQERGDKTPFFLVGGGAVNIKNLSRCLGETQPFYALQWRSLGAERAMTCSVEEAAAVFVQEMRKVQPSGPYYLGGSFASGVIAVEMALQLRRAGESVALLAGFDAIVRSHTPKKAGAPRKKGKAAAMIRALRRNGPVGLFKKLMAYDYRENTQEVIWKAFYRLCASFGWSAPTWMRVGIYEEFSILRATRVHRPSALYEGDLVLFLTPDRRRNFMQHPSFGWDGHVSGAVVAVGTPGDPCSIMLEPNVSALADGLKAQLEKARAGVSHDVAE